MTRETSGAVGVPTETERLAAVKEASATVLVGLRVVSTGLEGLGVLTMPVGRVSPAVAAASAPLGDAVFASLQADFATVSTVTASADTVLTGSGLASVGVLLGSTASPSDLKLFTDPSWADSIARDVFRALAGIYGRSS
jgi:hypothetical protein